MRYPWGDEINPALANCDNQTGTTLVGSYPPNNYGLFDMAGNVWEWVADWYDPHYYGASPDRNPRGLEPHLGIGQRKASRGGSWRHHVKVSRCSARSSIPPEFHYADYGFRLACKLSPRSI